jgi:hypothetical protein
MGFPPTAVLIRQKKAPGTGPGASKKPKRAAGYGRAACFAQ